MLLVLHHSNVSGQEGKDTFRGQLNDFMSLPHEVFSSPTQSFTSPLKLKVLNV